MTSYEEAIRWLSANALGWRLVRAETTLVAGPTIGSPTEQRVTVQLEPIDGQVVLTGEGVSILDAVQRAIGGAL